MRGENYVFVGGVPRSGTSMFQKMLDGHTKIYGGPEFDKVGATIGLYKNYLGGIENKRQSLYYSKEEAREYFAQLLASFFDGILEKKGKKILSEKTPSNILYFEELSEFFSEAKFIRVVRDPRACLNSYQNVKRTNNAVRMGSNVYNDIREICNYLKAGEKYTQSNDSRFYTLFYEDLLNNPVKEMEKVCEFLGVEFEQQMLNTARPNDSSLLVEKGAAGMKGYITESFEKDLNSDLIDKWKSELSQIDQDLINHYMINLDVPSVHQKYEGFKGLSQNRLRLLKLKQHQLFRSYFTKD